MSTHGRTSRDELHTSAVLRLCPGRSKGEAVRWAVDIATTQLTVREKEKPYDQPCPCCQSFRKIIDQHQLKHTRRT